MFNLFSCKTEKTENKERKESEKVTEGKIIPEVQEIGNIFRPEMMKQEEIENKVGKNNYQFTITNSDLIDNDLKNTDKYAEQIVEKYYAFLIRINKPFNYDKIIVKIEHRNKKIENYEYSENEMLKILEKTKN